MHCSQATLCPHSNGSTLFIAFKCSPLQCQDHKLQYIEEKYYCESLFLCDKKTQEHIYNDYNIVLCHIARSSEAEIEVLIYL